MLETSLNKKVFSKVFVLMLALSMLLSVFAGQASACVSLPGGTVVLPSAVQAYIHGKTHVKVIVRGYHTIGFAKAKSCGLGLGLDRKTTSVIRAIEAVDNIATIDTVTAVISGTQTAVGGMSFVKNTVTTNELAASNAANDWFGFTAVVNADLVEGQAIDIIYEGTVTEGTTEAQVLAQLDAAGIAGGEVTAEGKPVAGGFSVATTESAVAIAAPTFKILLPIIVR